MRKVFLAVMVGLAIILAACTTTKDLERHLELVAVDRPKADEKGSATQPGAENRNPASKKEPTTPSGTPVQTEERQKSTSEVAAPCAEGEVNAGVPATPAPSQGRPSTPPVIVEKKVYVEKPIYYPENAAPAQAKPGEPVANAISQGVMKPKDYNGAMMLYDYDQMLVYQVFTMPLRVTDIYLEPGEKVIEQPFCGDTTRWNIGGGVSKTAGVDTQHLYLKPSEEGLETTLIINTDRRIYHLIIKSFKDTFMLAVMWRYPGSPGHAGTGMPYDFLSGNEKKNGADAASRQSGDQTEGSHGAFAIDPALMSSDYTVSYPKGNPPEWLPTMVLDDGGKTYIVLPDTVIHHELPAVFGENGELVNFRVKDNVVVIDRLMRKMQLKLRDVTVEIKKKGA